MSRDAIIEYARSRGLSVTRADAAHSIAVDAAPYRVEVVVPDAVCEWFITVRDGAGGEVFTDWCEHVESEAGQSAEGGDRAGTGQSAEGGDRAGTGQSAEGDMADEIVGFLSLIGPGKVRVRAAHTEAARLEVSYQGAWIDPWDITDGPVAAS